jgi:phospholipid-binding lipoprotein MlaA
MQTISMRDRLRAVLLVLVFLSTGCATGPHANPKDPLEPMNRKIAVFNDTLDDNVLKPVATGYRDYTPQLLQTGVGNFFRNLSDVLSTVNNGLQLKGRDTAESFMRVTVNTTVGIYGIFDVATHIGLERHPEDFGQTLGYWGVPDGPYLVLPLFGPSTVRDASMLPLELTLDPVSNHGVASERTVASVVRLVDRRASLLKTSSLLSGASIDKYSFTRDGYLQFRRNQVFDGNPPDDEQPDDPSAGTAVSGKPSAK